MGAVRIERIDPDRHDRWDFRSGDSAVDDWLRQDAVAADRPVGVVVHVVHVVAEGGRVVGCYRLGSFRVKARRPVTPLRAWSSNFERTPVSAVLVSGLGIDQRWQRRGLGTRLMWHALELARHRRARRASRLVVAHGETERAPGLDTRFGFRALTPTRDSVICRSGTFRPPSRLQLPHRTAPRHGATSTRWLSRPGGRPTVESDADL